MRAIKPQIGPMLQHNNILSLVQRISLHLHPTGERKLSRLTCFVCGPPYPWHCHNAPTASLGHDLYEEFVHNSAFAQLIYETLYD